MIFVLVVLLETSVASSALLRKTVLFILLIWLFSSILHYTFLPLQKRSMLLKATHPSRTLSFSCSYFHHNSATHQTWLFFAPFLKRLSHQSLQFKNWSPIASSLIPFSLLLASSHFHFRFRIQYPLFLPLPSSLLLIHQSFSIVLLCFNLYQISSFFSILRQLTLFLLIFP